MPSQRPSQSAIFLSELRVVLPLIVLPLKTPAKTYLNLLFGAHRRMRWGANLYMFFGVSRADRCEFGRVWSSLNVIISSQIYGSKLQRMFNTRWRARRFP